MTKLNLFLDLMGIIHNLHEVGVTSCAAYEARILINSVFDNYEENDGIALPESHRVFEDIFFTVEYMPDELQQYFHTIDNFNAKNKIHLKALPPQARFSAVEQVGLMAGLFNVLNELLELGINACNNHQALMQINDLFDYFMEVDNTPQAEYLTTALDENEDIISKERLNTFCDYIAIKKEAVQDLPQHIGESTSKHSKLMAGLFGILMDLSDPDVTSFNAREAFRKIDALFLPFEQQRGKDQEEKDQEGDTLGSLSHMFPDMQESLDKLRLCPFIKKESE